VADNLELARRGYEALASGDLETVTELLDPEVRWHGGDPDGPGSCNGRGEANAFIRAARDRGPLPEVVEMIPFRERVVVVLRPYSPDRQPEAEADEAGLRANVTFRDGKVIEMVAFDDPARALAAAGASD
jgi:uncharacterized protein